MIIIFLVFTVFTLLTLLNYKTKINIKVKHVIVKSTKGLYGNYKERNHRGFVFGERRVLCIFQDGIDVFNYSNHRFISLFFTYEIKKDHMHSTSVLSEKVKL